MTSSAPQIKSNSSKLTKKVFQKEQLLIAQTSTSQTTSTLRILSPGSLKSLQIPKKAALSPWGPALAALPIGYTGPFQPHLLTYTKAAFVSILEVPFFWNLTIITSEKSRSTAFLSSQYVQNHSSNHNEFLFMSLSLWNCRVPRGQDFSFIFLTLAISPGPGSQ